jgi:GrpB-like predicted nucleotidyltransferase (UPF0157 family)
MASVRVEVVDYDDVWPSHFEELRARIWPAVSGVAVAIEHVGSTSVPGLAAKPIIDIDVIVPHAPSSVDAVIESLAKLGSEHQGDLGVAGREAFRNSPRGSLPHHLYACVEGCAALRNHLIVRDRLRASPDLAREYGDLKKQLAREFPSDIDAYIAGKTELLCRILAASGMSADGLEKIRRVNAPTVTDRNTR